MASPTRVAIVTGATRGIGRAVAERLAGEGYAVVLSGRTKEAAEAAAADLRKAGGTASGLAADARRDEDQRRLVAHAEKEFGRLDVLVNNAGIGAFGRVEEISPEQFRDVLETNLFGPWYAIRHAAPLMKKNGGGFIVNIASLASVNAFAERRGVQRLEVRPARALRRRDARPAAGRDPRRGRDAGLRRHGLEPLARRPGRLLDAPAGGRGGGGRGPDPISGAGDSVPDRAASRETAEEVGAGGSGVRGQRLGVGGRGREPLASNCVSLRAEEVRL